MVKTGLQEHRRFALQQSVAIVSDKKDLAVRPNKTTDTWGGKCWWGPTIVGGLLQVQAWAAIIVGGGKEVEDQL